MKGKRKTGSKNVTLGLLIMYLVVMTWIILFKMELDIRLLRQMNLRSINLIPFAGSLIVNGKADMSEVILNIAVFIPFGTYLSMLDRKMSFIMKVLPVFVVSLMYEVLQYCFAIGASDITDLLGNTLGGIIGIGLFAVCSKILGEKTVRILNILAAVGTVAVVVLLVLLIVVNMALGGANLEEFSPHHETQAC